MIVVFSDEHDVNAKDLVRRWTDRGAVLMLPSDLSRAGWSCNSHDPTRSVCVIGGVRHRAPSIDGVLLRRSAVLASDLSHITPEDRNYVAAEMNAFLTYWLTAIARPVLNLPTPRTLSGPGWYPEHWMYYASKSGLRVRDQKRSVRLHSTQHPAWPEHHPPYIDLTVVGEFAIGEVSTGLTAKARELAKCAGVEFVRFRFDGSGDDATFLQADLFPPLDDERVEASVLAYFKARG
jgi:hypothetical protein